MKRKSRATFVLIAIASYSVTERKNKVNSLSGNMFLSALFSSGWGILLTDRNHFYAIIYSSKIWGV